MVMDSGFHQLFLVKDKSRWVKTSLATIERPVWAVRLQCFFALTLDFADGLRGTLLLKPHIDLSTTTASPPAVQIHKIQVFLNEASSRHTALARENQGLFYTTPDKPPSRVSLNVHGEEFSSKDGTTYFTLRSANVPASWASRGQHDAGVGLQLHITVWTTNGPSFTLRREVPVTLQSKSRQEWTLEQPQGAFAPRESLPAYEP